MTSLSIVIPVFNRDLNVIRYVVNDMLNNGVDEVVLSNTGQSRTGINHPRVLEVWQPLPIFYPGVTRNMGAVIANGDVQVHAGADILLASGSWDVYRTLNDRTTGSTACALLNPTQTKDAMKGKRAFPARYCKTSTAAFGMTKRVAMEVLKGPFDWEMRKWGWVDVDALKRARRAGLRHKMLGASILHLNHAGGCCSYSKSTRTTEFKHNSRLMEAKTRTTGWWSGLPKTNSIRGEIPMTAGKPAIIATAMREDEYQICGELDFHSIPDAVQILKTAYDSLKPGQMIRITFNNIDKLGKAWSRSRANQKNSHGRVRKTFWTMGMIQQALSDAGFNEIVESNIHIGRSPFGVSTAVGFKPKPPEKVEAKLEVEAEPDAPKVDTSPTKRRRGRPKGSRNIRSNNGQ